MSSKLKKSEYIKKVKNYRKDLKKDSQNSETTTRKEFQQLISDINTAYNTAITSTDLGDIFLIFPIIFECFIEKKQKVRKKNKSEFISWMNKVLKILNQLFPKKPNWKRIFYSYCLNCQSERLKAFSSEKIEHFISIVLEFVSIIQSDETSASQDIISVPYCLSLVQYFQRHKVDSLSCLIGLRASKEVIDEIIKSKDNNNNSNLSNTSNNYNTVNSNLSSQKKASSSDIKLNMPSLSDQEIFKIANLNQELIQKIFDWSRVEDAASLQQEIREYAGELRGTKELEMGAIIIAEIEKNFYIFCRYSGERSGNYLHIYTEPFEDEITIIRIDKVFPLKGNIDKKVRGYEITDLERLIQLPTDTLYHEEMANVENRITNYLLSLNVDMKVIKKANNNECSISELKQLKISQQTLQDLKADPPLDLINEMQAKLKAKVTSIIQNQDILRLFKPTQKKTIEQLSSFHIKELVNMNITRHIGVCYSGLDQLQLQKRDLMNGVRKENLVSWWLDEIDKRVMEYLIDLGFQPTAIPQNYSEEAPSDFEMVLKNLKLLDKILGEDDPYKLSSLIQEMKDKIYPKIDLFIDDAKIVLSEHFEMDLTCDDFSIENVQLKYEIEKDKIDPLVSIWIDDIIKDLIYLNEMKELENPNYSKERSLHIVPISGLVAGVICRFQNECKTVLDFWDYYDEKSDEKAYDIHQAVLNGDLTKIQDILKSETITLNRVDSYGSSPLILACQSFDYTICKELLQYDAVNVNIQNFEGYTALHCLCKLKPLNNETHIEEIVKLLIIKGSRLDSLTKKGETLLSLCAFSDNHVALRIILQTNIIFTQKDINDCFIQSIKNHSHKALSVLSQSRVGSTQFPVNSELEKNECCFKLLKSSALTQNHHEDASPRQMWSTGHSKERKHIHIALGRKGTSTPNVSPNLIYKEPQ